MVNLVGCVGFIDTLNLNPSRELIRKSIITIASLM